MDENHMPTGFWNALGVYIYAYNNKLYLKVRHMKQFLILICTHAIMF